MRFRENTDLCELTPTHQSGGERSVAIILYMMALQELTVVPFRVVDEINQGKKATKSMRITQASNNLSCIREFNLSTYYYFKSHEDLK